MTQTDLAADARTSDPARRPRAPGLRLQNESVAGRDDGAYARLH